jgi:hypothetical protein
MKGALGMERISLKRLSAEGLCGGLLYWGTPKDMLSKALKWASVSIGAPLLGDMEGICLPGRFERKREYIRVPFLDPEDIRILSVVAIWNFVKGQSSHELISDYGAQRACL